MKKLSVFIAMILCVTIGGVYAAWYFTNNTDVTDISSPVAVNLEVTQNAGSIGSFAISKTATTTPIRVDQKATGDHTAVLKSEGEIIVTFTPNENAEATIKENGIDCYIYFSGNIADIKYEGQQVFAFSKADSFETKITLAKEDAVKTSIGTDIYSLSWDITDIVVGLADSVIQLANTFELDTFAKYKAFETAITNVAITVHVTDGTVTPVV